MVQVTTVHQPSDEFPAGTPEEGLRGDRYAYRGIHLKVWLDEKGRASTALYRHESLDSDQVDRLLERLRDGLAEWHREDDVGDWSALDAGVSETGQMWGPGTQRGIRGHGVPADDLADAALADVTGRLSSPSIGLG